MVYYKKEAYEDLNNIFYGLIFWEKRYLAPEHAQQYIQDIEDTCNSLDIESFHTKSVYSFHKKYGDYVCRYKRNKNTVWYIIYNIDFYGNIWIEKITNNYLTTG